MSIRKLVISCRVTEAASAVKEIIAAYESQKELASEETLATMIAELRDVLQRLIEAINILGASSELADKNAVRNEIIRKLSKVLDGYANVPVDTIMIAGEAALAVFNLFGASIANESYGVKTILVHSLLRKFEEPSVVKHTKTLIGVDILLAALKAAQKDFDIAQNTYDHAVITEKENNSATTIKNQIVPLLNTKLVTYMASMKAFNADHYGNFASHIEKSISKINEAVKRRGNGSEPEPENNPNPDAE